MAQGSWKLTLGDFNLGLGISAARILVEERGLLGVYHVGAELIIGNEILGIINGVVDKNDFRFTNLPLYCFRWMVTICGGL
jgi:hypothetical protein